MYKGRYKITNKYIAYQQSPHYASLYNHQLGSHFILAGEVCVQGDLDDPKPEGGVTGSAEGMVHPAANEDRTSVGSDP